jgi:hypothetical protein
MINASIELDLDDMINLQIGKTIIIENDNIKIKIKRKK